MENVKNYTKIADKEKIETQKCYEYISKKMFEANKLSKDEMIQICYEFCDLYCELSNKNQSKNNRNKSKPMVKIIENLDNIKHKYYTQIEYRGKFWSLKDKYLKYIDYEIDNPCRSKSNPSLFGIYSFMLEGNDNIGGICGYFWDYYRIYKLETSKLKNFSNIKFLNWYKKSLELYAIFYNQSNNLFEVVPKPDEWVLKKKENMYYRYNNEKNCYLKHIKVPDWLYFTAPEDLNPKDYLLLKNADVKYEFIKKIGIERLINLGIVIDTYENYPDNIWWQKSEYKLIDMSSLEIPEIVNGTGHIIKKRDYAPFLYMKNQTTGGYHLEGIHPRCKDLYDALKMRYNNINLEKIKVLDVK